MRLTQNSEPNRHFSEYNPNSLKYNALLIPFVCKHYKDIKIAMSGNYISYSIFIIKQVINITFILIYSTNPIICLWYICATLRILI